MPCTFRVSSPRIGQRNKLNNKRKMASSCVGGILKVLVSFYRHGEEQAFERHRSRVTSDQEKHLNINSMQKHLRDFLGLSDLTKQFGMPDFKIKMFRLSRSFWQG